MPSPQRLAVFDLDGTISVRDTFAPYIAGFLLRHPWRVPRLVLLLAVLLRYALGRADRGELKAAMIQAALGGLPRGVVTGWTRRYVPRVVPARLFGDALEVIASHRAAGDRLVLMSASPDLFVPAIGAALGFDEVICTEVRWSGDRLDGRLVTANRRDDEKRRCLELLRARHPGLPVTAYGNSDADFAHLRVCERGVFVNGTGTLLLQARSLGLSPVNWR